MVHLVQNNSYMDNRDKLLLVFYVNCSDEQFARTRESILAGIKSLGNLKDEIIVFILPDLSLIENSIKLDCINPKIVDKEQYESIKIKLEEISSSIKLNINDSK